MIIIMLLVFYKIHHEGLMAICSLTHTHTPHTHTHTHTHTNIQTHTPQLTEQKRNFYTMSFYHSLKQINQRRKRSSGSHWKRKATKYVGTMKTLSLAIPYSRISMTTSTIAGRRFSSSPTTSAIAFTAIKKWMCHFKSSEKLILAVWCLYCWRTATNCPAPLSRLLILMPGAASVTVALLENYAEKLSVRCLHDSAIFPHVYYLAIVFLNVLLSYRVPCIGI